MRTHKNQLLIVSLLLVAVLVVIGIIVYAAKNDVDPLSDDNPANDDVNTQDVNTIEGTFTDSEEGFTAYATYQQNNSWMYTIQGELPNPCYSTLTDIIISDSFPEQVILQLTINSPEPDVVCTQMIQEVNIDGEYHASEDATMNLRVVRD